MCLHICDQTMGRSAIRLSGVPTMPPQEITLDTPIRPHATTTTAATAAAAAVDETHAHAHARRPSLASLVSAKGSLRDLDIGSLGDDCLAPFEGQSVQVWDEDSCQHRAAKVCECMQVYTCSYVRVKLKLALHVLNDVPISGETSSIHNNMLPYNIACMH